MAQSCLIVTMAWTHNSGSGRTGGWIWCIDGLVIRRVASLLGESSVIFALRMLIRSYSQHFAATSSGQMPGNCTKSSQGSDGEVDILCKSTGDWWPESTMIKHS